eukprot:6303323-Pyramimonas_sp.AAC.1
MTSSRCKHPTKAGPSKSRTRSPGSVGEPEFRRTRVLRFPKMGVLATPSSVWAVPEPGLS